MVTPLVLHQPPHEQDELLPLWGMTARPELVQVDADVVDRELLGWESARECPAPDVLGHANEEARILPEFAAPAKIDASRHGATEMLVVAGHVVAVEGHDQGHIQAPADGQRQTSVNGEVSMDKHG
jgi:hypothetical protein